MRRFSFLAVALFVVVVAFPVRASDPASAARAALALAAQAPRPPQAPAARPAVRSTCSCECECGCAVTGRCGCVDDCPGGCAVATVRATGITSDDARYARAYEKALAEGRELVVHVGAWREDVRAAYPDAAQVRLSTFDGFDSGEVVVGRFRRGRVVVERVIAVESVPTGATYAPLGAAPLPAYYQPSMSYRPLFSGYRSFGGGCAGGRCR